MIIYTICAISTSYCVFLSGTYSICCFCRLEMPLRYQGIHEWPNGSNRSFCSCSSFGRVQMAKWIPVLLSSWTLESVYIDGRKNVSYVFRWEAINQYISAGCTSWRIFNAETRAWSKPPFNIWRQLCGRSKWILRTCVFYQYIVAKPTAASYKNMP